MNDKTEKHGCMYKKAMERHSKGEMVLEKAHSGGSEDVNQER